MISAIEARNRVNREVTEDVAKQLRIVEEMIEKTIKAKQTSFTISGSLYKPVKDKLIDNHYIIHEYDENERGMYSTVTTISF